MSFNALGCPRYHLVQPDLMLWGNEDAEVPMKFEHCKETQCSLQVQHCLISSPGVGWIWKIQMWEGGKAVDRWEGKVSSVAKCPVN